MKTKMTAAQKWREINDAAQEHERGLITLEEFMGIVSDVAKGGYNE